MATVTGITAAKAQKIENASVVDGFIDTNGFLILVTKGGEQINAGYALANVGPIQEKVDQVAGTVDGYNDTFDQIHQDILDVKDQAVSAAVLRIDSSKGSVFKNNSISTVLTVTIFYAGQAITDITTLHEALGVGAYLEWFWRREDDTGFNIVSSADNRLSQAGFALTVSPDDVDEKTIFQCILHA